MIRVIALVVMVTGAWWYISTPNIIKPGDARYEYMANYQPHLMVKRQELMTQVHQFDSTLHQMDVLKWNAKQAAAIQQMKQQISVIREQRNILIDHVNQIDEQVEKGVANMFVRSNDSFEQQKHIQQLIHQVTGLIEQARTTTSVIDYDLNRKSPPRAIPTGNNL